MASPVVASQTNVDDLLAQLAGEEIDRLLAEAESGRAPAGDEPAFDSPAHDTAAAWPIGPSGQTPPIAAKSIDPATAAQLDEPFAHFESQQLASPPASKPEAPPTIVEMGPALTAAPAAVAPQRNLLHAGADVAPAPAETESASVLSAAEAASPAYASVPELATTAAERDALDLDLPSAPVDPASERPTFLVRCLELANAPLVAAPEVLREFVGKIALVTFFNAVAVLAYVLIFRKHH